MLQQYNSAITSDLNLALTELLDSAGPGNEERIETELVEILKRVRALQQTIATNGADSYSAPSARSGRVGLAIKEVDISELRWILDDMAWNSYFPEFATTGLNGDETSLGRPLLECLDYID